MKPLLTTLTTFTALCACALAGPLDGVWINTDAESRSIPKVEIAGTQFVWWGKTHPQDSKYGPMPLTLLGDSVNDSLPNKYGFVTEDVHFATHVMIMKIVGEQLVLESLKIFKDGSNRANYQQTLTFKRQAAAEEANVQYRTWTGTAGTTIFAKLLSVKEDQVELLKEDGQVISGPLSALSAGDQAIAKEQMKSSIIAQPENSKSKLPGEFPKDEMIDRIPILKKQASQPVSFTFIDAVSNKTIEAEQLLGKYIYVHTLFFQNDNERALMELKILHEKYAAKGFEIITVQPWLYSNNSSPNLRTPAIKKNLEKAIADYAISWLISFPSKEGKNPLSSKVSSHDQFGCLFDPEGRLIHTNVIVDRSLGNSGSKPVHLASALKMVFPD